MTPQRVASFLTYPDNHHHLEQIRIPAYLKVSLRKFSLPTVWLPCKSTGVSEPAEDIFVREQAQKENRATRIGVGAE